VRVLNDVEPSEDVLWLWAYDENVTLIEQDEDLIFHEPDFVQLLMEFAADDNCPKQDYCLSILHDFGQLVVLHRDLDRARLINDRASESRVEAVGPNRWKDSFAWILDRLVNPRRLSDEDMVRVAKALSVGEFCLRDFSRTGRVVERYHEFLASTESYRLYVYVNPDSGRWTHSTYQPLDAIQ
jgi:hypothetical protein